MFETMDYCSLTPTLCSGIDFLIGLKREWNKSHNQG